MAIGFKIDVENFLCILPCFLFLFTRKGLLTYVLKTILLTICKKYRATYSSITSQSSNLLQNNFYRTFSEEVSAFPIQCNALWLLIKSIAGFQVKKVETQRLVSRSKPTNCQNPPAGFHLFKSDSFWPGNPLVGFNPPAFLWLSSKHRKTRL